MRWEDTSRMVPMVVPAAVRRSAHPSCWKPNTKPLHLTEITQHWAQKPSLAGASWEVLPLRNSTIRYFFLQTSAQELAVSLGSCKAQDINAALTTGYGEATKKTWNERQHRDWHQMWLLVEEIIQPRKTCTDFQWKSPCLLPMETWESCWDGITW